MDEIPATFKKCLKAYSIPYWLTESNNNDLHNANSQLQEVMTSSFKGRGENHQILQNKYLFSPAVTLQDD